MSDNNNGFISNGEVGKRGTSCPTKKKQKELKLPKCYVNFRPGLHWQGEYGFDWMRDGNWEIENFGHVKFEDIAGKYISDLPAGDIRRLLNDGPYGTFEKTSGVYNILRNKYKPEVIDYKNTGETKNFVSYLSFYSTEASPLSAPIDLTLQVFIEEKNSLKELIFKYDHTILGIACSGLPTSGTHKGKGGIGIGLQFYKVLTQDEQINVSYIYKDRDGSLVESKKILGSLIIKANDTNHRKIKNCIVFQIKTADIGNGSGGSGFAAQNQFDFASNILKNQTLIDIRLIDGGTLDLSTEADFSQFKIDVLSSKKCVRYADRDDETYESLNDYCQKKLIEKYSGDIFRLKEFSALQDSNYIKVLFFKEPFVSKNKSKLTQVYGSTNQKTNYIVISNFSTKETLAHELLHALGLEHTFANVFSHSPEIVDTVEILPALQAEKTENIMDYTQPLITANSNITIASSFSLFHWQCEKANQKAEPEPRPKGPMAPMAPEKLNFK